MGRWRLIDDFGKVVDTGVTNIYCQSNASAEAAKMLHNADCDAYEARIAELELKLKQGADYFSELMSKRDFAVKNLRAELARVKAESLRVVVDGDACDVCQCKTQYFIDEDKELYECSPEVVGDCRDVRHFINGMEGFFSDVRVRPVRLELWETEE